MVNKIPQEVMQVLKQLTDADFEAYIVGGCVRDLIMDMEPKDWDVTTNATPEQIQEIFPDSFYENEFGTVGVKTRTGADSRVAKQIKSSLDVIEVTTYRLETTYSNKRHPDEVTFTKKLEDDLQRRDFTMNAIALDVEGKVIDPYNGQDDIKARTIRAVGDASQRFNEDALRMMRAIRFASTLEFEIEESTMQAIAKLHEHLGQISQERVRDEFSKLIMGDNAYNSLLMLQETNMLKYILPELLEGIDVGQNLHHIYTVWEHNLLSFKYAVEQGYSFEVRLASLLHDVGKPRTKGGDGYNSTFYNHDVVGATMTHEVLERLRFSKDIVKKVRKLVRWHMFHYDTEVVTESAVRRLVANIGKENVEDLIKVREADRIGSGVSKAKPYKLRHLQFMIDKVSRDPISPKMLKINGHDIMELLNIEPGPKVGMIVGALMEEVLDEPKNNTKEYLEDRAEALSKMSGAELLQLKKSGQEKIAQFEEMEVSKIKKKHYIN